MAPELLVLTPKYSKQSDIYALGIVLWEIASRKIPFSGADQLVVIQEVKKGEREEIPNDCPYEFEQIIRGCWEQEPLKRLDLETIKQQLVLCLQEMGWSYQEQLSQKNEQNDFQSNIQRIPIIEQQQFQNQQQVKVEELQTQNQQVGQVQYKIQNFDNITTAALTWFLNQLKEQEISVYQVKQIPLNRSGLIIQTNILLELKELNLKDIKIEQKLLEVVELSKQSEEVEKAGANALTLLNYMGYRFVDKDFRGIRVALADLSGGTFEICNFENANMESCNLKNTSFRNCNFEGANLTKTELDQKSTLNGHTDWVYSVAISSDNK